MFAANHSFVCLDCRRTIKAGHRLGAGPDCPQCGKPMRLAGDAFKAPRREALVQWRKIKMLLSAGIVFWGHYHRSRTPMWTIGEAKATVRAIRSKLRYRLHD